MGNLFYSLLYAVLPLLYANAPAPPNWKKYLIELYIIQCYKPYTTLRYIYLQPVACYGAPASCKCWWLDAWKRVAWFPSVCPWACLPCASGCAVNSISRLVIIFWNKKLEIIFYVEFQLEFLTEFCSRAIHDILFLKTGYVYVQGHFSDLDSNI